MSPLAALLPERPRWFALGAWTTTVVAVLTHIVIVGSGSARLVMADHAEQWTSQELAPLRRAGWKVVHRVLFRGNEDIDSVLIGPAGVVVVETKWASEDWSSKGQQRWITAAVVQARSNARLLARQIGQRIGEVPTHCVVALWPSDTDFESRTLDDVIVLPGLGLRQWIQSLSPASVDRDRIERAWSFLGDHVAGRDAYDLRQHGAMPRSPSQYVVDVLQFPFGLVVGLLVFGFALDWFGWPTALVPGAACTAGCAYALRTKAIHRLVAGMFVGLGSVALGVALVWVSESLFS